jgi:hypothetical protein
VGDFASQDSRGIHTLGLIKLCSIFMLEGVIYNKINSVLGCGSPQRHKGPTSMAARSQQSSRRKNRRGRAFSATRQFGTPLHRMGQAAGPPSLRVLHRRAADHQAPCRQGLHIRDEGPHRRRLLCGLCPAARQPPAAGLETIECYFG